MPNLARWFPQVAACTACQLLFCWRTPLCLHVLSPVLHTLPIPTWPQGKVVFVAPTKPLVAQQVDACHSFMGMSKAGFCELTGERARDCGRAHVISGCISGWHGFAFSFPDFCRPQQPGSAQGDVAGAARAVYSQPNSVVPVQ